MEKRLVVLLLLAVMELAPAELVERYVGVGGELKVEPPQISGPITGVLWKHNVNLLAEWMKDSVDLTYYGKFKGRTTLDTTTGVLQVLNMGVEDAGLYSVEINSKQQDLTYNVKVIEEVSEPKVLVQPLVCSSALEKCTLRCDGETAGSEPVSYYWRKEDGGWEQSEKDLVILKNETDNVKTFSCRMKNPISHKDSKPENNPFLQSDGPSGGVVGGVVGGIFLLLVIIAIVLSFVFRDKLFALLNTIFHPDAASANGGAGSELKTEEGMPLNSAKENLGSPTSDPAGEPTSVAAGGPTSDPAGGPTSDPAGGPTSDATKDDYENVPINSAHPS